MTEPVQQVEQLKQQIALFKELTAATNYEEASQLLTNILPIIGEIVANAGQGLIDNVEVEQLITQFSAYLSSELKVLENNSELISAEIRNNFSSKLVYSEGIYRKQYGK